MTQEYSVLLEKHGMDNTPNRLRVLEIVGGNKSPLTAQEVFDTLSRTQNVNRVTIYRILELFVENKLLERISGGDRAFRYGLKDRPGEKNHPHFYCTHCGSMECLTSESIQLNMEPLKRSFAGTIEKVEIRVDGICRTCLKAGQKE